jgi:enamine deaminase RidA (YjgF/YER057c/UK114 family)
MEIERKLEEMGLVLPERTQARPEMRLPFAPVRARGHRAYLSGALALNDDGSLAEPRGKVGGEVTVEQAYESARRVALAHLAALKRELGDLDRVTAWLKVLGMVNVAPGFVNMPAVVNGYSDLIIELYGPERGAHARSAVGMAALPANGVVEIEAEVEIDGMRAG